MLKELIEFKKYVGITGYKGVKIRDAREFARTISKKLPTGVEVQLFDADLVATWEHLYFAVFNALLAFQTGRNLSNSIAVESALYCSAQRQITKALAQIGLKRASENAAVLVVGDDANSVETGLKVVSEGFGLEPDVSILELSRNKVNRIKKEFEVSDVELGTVSSRANQDETLVNVVVERVALLSTRL